MRVRGACVFKGYERRARDAESSDAEGSAIGEGGWFCTGDAGVLDPRSGHLRLTGRFKELINRAGGRPCSSRTQAVASGTPLGGLS